KPPASNVTEPPGFTRSGVSVSEMGFLIAPATPAAPGVAAGARAAAGVVAGAGVVEGGGFPKTQPPASVATRAGMIRSPRDMKRSLDESGSGTGARLAFASGGAGRNAPATRIRNLLLVLCKRRIAGFVTGDRGRDMVELLWAGAWCVV